MPRSDIPVITPYNPLDKRNLAESVASAMLHTPVQKLPPEPFIGAGVYAIYYKGDFEPYRKLVELNQDGWNVPIYVGKAVPAGARKGGFGVNVDHGQALANRLSEHFTSVSKASNLDENDFVCRFLVVDDIWIPLAESMMIERFKPLWNRCIDGFGNHEVRSYNEQLESTVRQLLNERKNKASDFFSISKALKIPLNLNSSAPNLTPIPLKKPHRANLNEPKQHAPEKQYYIDDADFENIVRIIHICGMALEESARTFNRFNEEELRDYIKGMLTSHYENAVTGETFRRVGKTDIQIQRDDKAAFIAECKVWHGIKLFSDAIDHLFCYATWKDTKLSLVVFNKDNKNFAGIQQQVQNWIKENCKSYKQWNSNIWDCVKYREDTGRDVRLAIALYDVSIKELPSSKKN